MLWWWYLSPPISPLSPPTSPLVPPTPPEVPLLRWPSSPAQADRIIRIWANGAQELKPHHQIHHQMIWVASTSINTAVGATRINPHQLASTRHRLHEPKFLLQFFLTQGGAQNASVQTLLLRLCHPLPECRAINLMSQFNIVQPWVSLGPCQPFLFTVTHRAPSVQESAAHRPVSSQWVLAFDVPVAVWQAPVHQSDWVLHPWQSGMVWNIDSYENPFRKVYNIIYYIYIHINALCDQTLMGHRCTHVHPYLFGSPFPHSHWALASLSPDKAARMRNA